MPSFSATLFLFTLVAFVAALATPHAARNLHHHRAIAARALPPSTSLRRRATSGRCKSRSSSSTTSTTSTTATPAVANVAPTPDVSITASVPTTSSSPSPSPTSAKPSSTTSQATSSATSASSNLPSYLVGTQTGQGTFYSTGLGACGITNVDSDYIAAVSLDLFDTFPNYDGVNPNNNPVCNKQIKATYQGKSVTITVTDRCTGCAVTDLDFSPAAFNTLADPSLGRISGVTWVWLS